MKGHEPGTLGLPRVLVRVVESDPRWATLFEAAAREITDTLPVSGIALEHVGSTAVPGLSAKPVIDMALLIPEEAAFQQVRERLATLAFAYRGDKGTRGGRLFVRECAPEVRTHHLHLYIAGAPEWDRYLLFRDTLRARPELRDAYARLKRQLAQQFPEDRFAYLDGKTAFVEGVLRESEAIRASAGESPGS